MPEPPTGDVAFGPGERPHRSVPVALEVGRQGQEQLSGGQRVALGLVRTVGRQAQGAHNRREAAPARIIQAAIKAEQSPQQGRLDRAPRPGRAPPAERRGRNARSTQAAWATGIRPRTATASGARASGAGPAVSRSAGAARGSRRTPRPAPASAGPAAHRRPGRDSPCLDRYRGEGDDLVAPGIEARCLHVHGDETRRAP
jgi:hypothetical protein